MHIDINLDEQKLRLHHGNQRWTYPISSGKAGIGCEEGSGKTPTGKFRICSKHGEGAAAYTTFKARLPVGTWDTNAPQEHDPITARILCLEGLDAENANTRARYIYIHGTSDLENIGRPASMGCIRMLPQDIIHLYSIVGLACSVQISPH